MIKILMVCTGNICRSPLAHGVLQAKLLEQQLDHLATVDSAGTSDYHQGAMPDRRMQQAARQHGYDLSDIRARGITQEDLSEFDWLLGMTQSHIDFMQRHAQADDQEKIRLLMSFAQAKHKHEVVSDPYYGGDAGFVENIQQIELATDGLVQWLLAQAS